MCQHNHPDPDPQPIRFVARAVERRDPVTGEVTLHPVSRTEIKLGVDGDTQIYEIESPTDTWDCGHPMTRQLAGRCADSRQLCCDQCLTCCGALAGKDGTGAPSQATDDACGKPISRQAAYQTEVNGTVYLFCNHCHQRYGQKRRRRTAARMLLNFFFRFEDQDK